MVAVVVKEGSIFEDSLLPCKAEAVQSGQIKLTVQG
jgi:hypothetical protein